MLNLFFTNKTQKLLVKHYHMNAVLLQGAISKTASLAWHLASSASNPDSSSTFAIASIHRDNTLKIWAWFKNRHFG